MFGGGGLCFGWFKGLGGFVNGLGCFVCVVWLLIGCLVIFLLLVLLHCCRRFVGGLWVGFVVCLVCLLC